MNNEYDEYEADYGAEYDDEYEAEHTQFLEFLLALETNPTHEIKAKQGEADNPDAEIDLAVKQMPVVGLVSHAEELETEGNFDEA